MADIFQTTFLKALYWMKMYKFRLRFHGSLFLGVPALVQIITWRRAGDRPLSEPMMICLLTHICVTRPQWVKDCDVLQLLSSFNNTNITTWQEYITLQWRHLSLICLRSSVTWLLFQQLIEANNKYHRKSVLWTFIKSHRWLDCCVIKPAKSVAS